jgi:hypothetical protein
MMWKFRTWLALKLSSLAVSILPVEVIEDNGDDMWPVKEQPSVVVKGYVKNK